MNWSRDLTNMMGKRTLLYLSISLPLIPNILCGGLGGGREGRGSCTGWGWPFLTWWWSRGRVSCPPVMAQVIIQQEWSCSWVWKDLGWFVWLILLLLGTISSEFTDPDGEDFKWQNINYFILYVFFFILSVKVREKIIFRFNPCFSSI